MDLERGNVIVGYAGLTEPSDFNKNILICVPKMNEGLTGVEQNEGYIQASRALVIAAVVCGTFGVVAALIGIQCSKAGGENYTLKGRIAGTGGVFFLLQGLCTMVSVSWYAANITQEFFNPLYPGQKYEIGEALYLGWASGVLAICGGVCLMFSCNLGSKEKTGYPYQPTRETVYSASTSRREAQSTYGRNAYV
ncbi:claudin-15a isoform X2 [Ctenopharyngodon idella]|uniref:claudin-15a isoform X2 n=1 Tax=Ctenopharyngodon idella TaxID=7959 RepID=UPI0022323003|nr:claudin-15a isoform X2 [Ctenopharyngodon idella]